MSPSWQNPNYEREQRRRLSLVVLTAVLLVAVAATISLSLRNRTPKADASAENARKPVQAEPVSRPAPADPLEAYATDPWPGAPEAPFEEGDIAPGAEEEAETESGQGQPNSFAALKASAFSLYRQNKLEAALEQVQAALALQRDDELLELLAKLKREIRVQRDYDDARTANFTVLFDGYEHEEIKTTVLDILKDAYADVGKELDHFPEEPITVILYTGKDFSDVTRAPEWAGGMFGKLDGKIRLPVKGVVGQEALLRRVLYHEYTHALLHSKAPGTPLWLHEGLAQYCSGDRAVSISQVIPLTMLANGFPRAARAAYAAYMESLQVVTDLVDEHGMPPLRRLLNELGAGKGIEAAFAAAYGKPFSRWAEQWRPVERGEAAEAEPGREGEDG